jgi:hypothetical protein
MPCQESSAHAIRDARVHNGRAPVHWPPSATAQGQTRGEFLHHRHVGSSTVLILSPAPAKAGGAVEGRTLPVRDAGHKLRR